MVLLAMLLTGMVLTATMLTAIVVMLQRPTIWHCVGEHLEPV